MSDNSTVVSIATGQPVRAEEAAVERFLAGLGDVSWFSALGLPPTEDERGDAGAYLAGLGLEALEVDWIDDIARARDLSQEKNWSRAWWQAEERSIAALTAGLEEAIGKPEATALLNRAMSAASTVVMGPAAVATARLGVADQGLNRAMAGAATQAVYAMALLVATQAEPRAHPLAAKYRLFTAGHWPLVVVEGRFYVI